MTGADVQAVADKLEIQEQLARYARGVDTQDWELSSSTGGYYRHDFVRTPDGWKSEHLVEEPVWFLNRPGA